MKLSVSIAACLLWMCVALCGGDALAASDPLFDSPVLSSPQRVEFDAVNRKLKEHHGLRAVFQQTKHLSVLNRPLTSSGEFVYVEGRGVLWRQKEPFRQTFVITERGFSEQLEDGNIQRSPEAAAGAIQGFSGMFLGLFSGDINLLGDQFELFFVGNEKSWEIGARPRNGDISRFIDRIKIKGGAVPEQVTVWEKNGDISEIKLMPLTK